MNMEITYFTKNQKMSSAVKWGLFFGFLGVLLRIVNRSNNSAPDADIISLIASFDSFIDHPVTGIVVGWAIQFGLWFAIGYLIGKMLSWKRILPKNKN